MHADNMPMEPFDKHKEVANLLELCVKKFRQAPSKNEAFSIVNLLCEKLKLKEIISYLEGLHHKHKTFPYLSDVEKDVVLIERARKFQYPEKPQIKEKEKPWISAQAPGTPAQAEALFNKIKSGTAKGLAFDLLRQGRLMGSLTDEQLWEAYEAWCKGEIHPLIQEDVFKC